MAESETELYEVKSIVRHQVYRIVGVIELKVFSTLDADPATLYCGQSSNQCDGTE